MANRNWVLLLAVTLSACQASPTPLPTPVELEAVLVTPPLLPQASEWLQAFQFDAGQLALSISPAPYPSAVEALQNESAGVYLTTQNPPADWWASPLGSEPIAVVVHSSNSVRRLTRSELIQILSGQATDWEVWTGESLPIEVIFPLPGDEFRARFMDLLSPGLQLAPNARLASDPTMLAELVADEPGRIGILPYSLVGSDLKLIRIDGALPDSAGYPFSVDIIATAPQEPEGSIRAWLVWLQQTLELDEPASPEAQATQTTGEPNSPTATNQDEERTSTAPPTRTPPASQPEE